MCGISGLVNRKGEAVNQSILQKMTDLIAYRGPDDFGYYYNNNVGLGHRRLSILDLSSAGQQPMSFGNLHITYNGEIYNYLEIRTELIAKGYSFVTGTDTEVILKAFDCWETDSFHKFNGMWSLVIYNSETGKLICSRDRYGIKPFCYTVTDSYFAFGSESKQLLEVEDFKKSINLGVAYNYLVHGELNLDDQTFFKDLFELRGGYMLLYDCNTQELETKQWYNLGLSTKQKLTFEQASTQFEEYFTKSVALRMRSDVTVGSCLSGGLDSSAIVCSVEKQNIGNEAFKTISSCYLDKASDEQHYIDIVTKHTGQTSVKIFPDLGRLITENIWDKIIYHQDQPIISFSHFSEFAVFEAASQNNVTVMLDGQGSDEYLAGYTEFLGVYTNSLLRKFKLVKYLSFIRKRANLLGQPFGKSLVFRIINDLKKQFIKVPSRNKHFSPSFLTTNQRSKPKYLNINDISFDMIKRTSIPYQLHSEDRNSMLHSIESRLPFLDFRLVEFAMSQPGEYKLRNAETKALLRDSMDTTMPKEIIDRHDKKGFPAPDAELFKTHSDHIKSELKKTVRDNPNIFNESLVQSFTNFLDGKENYDSLWLRAISFNKWRETFKV